MNKEKIVIIGANEFQQPLIKRAKEMEFETHVFAWEEGAVGKAEADYFYPISITEKEKIYQISKEINPAAVATIASDLATITVQYVAQRLGLPCNSLECVKLTTNKYEMRKSLQKNGIYVPKFQMVKDISDLKEVKFPCIVKPIDRSGSRAITKVIEMSELKKAVEYARQESFLGYAIVEEFIEGVEYSCESITYNGRHQFLAITKKYTTEAPAFIEIGHVEPAGLNEKMEKKVISCISEALDALQITQGAAHAEFKIDEEQQVRIIEIGARMGGDFIGSDLVEQSTGYDYVGNVIRVALGKKPDMFREQKKQKTAVRFLFSEKDDVNVQQYIKNENGEVICCDKTCIDWSLPVKSSADRKGYYILKLPQNADEKLLFIR